MGMFRALVNKLFINFFYTNFIEIQKVVKKKSFILFISHKKFLKVFWKGQSLVTKLIVA